MQTGNVKWFGVIGYYQSKHIFRDFLTVSTHHIVSELCEKERLISLFPLYTIRENETSHDSEMDPNGQVKWRALIFKNHELHRSKHGEINIHFTVPFYINVLYRPTKQHTQYGLPEQKGRQPSSQWVWGLHLWKWCFSPSWVKV